MEIVKHRSKENIVFKKIEKSKEGKSNIKKSDHIIKTVYRIQIYNIEHTELSLYEYLNIDKEEYDGILLKWGADCKLFNTLHKTRGENWYFDNRKKAEKALKELELMWYNNREKKRKETRTEYEQY